MDDRIAVAVLIEPMGAETVTMNASLQRVEEVGLPVQSTAYGVDPDLGIAVDVTLSDTPGAPGWLLNSEKVLAVKVRDGRDAGRSIIT